jgi:hypothetical protein
MPQQASYSIDELQANHCLENVDRVANDPQTTEFKRRARLHQARWRQVQDFPIGSHPMRAKPERARRPLGSRVDVEFAYTSNCNFLDPAVTRSVEHRLSNGQEHQTLNADRLYCDLLSSMPMCFNLFGMLRENIELADRALHAWFPDVPGKVSAVLFEWSPQRRVPGRFLENASAFDVAFELDLGGGKKGIFGIETKYHEDCRRESKPPSDQRIERYKYVTEASQAFVDNAANDILGTDLQQIWLDHLLALSIPLDAEREWGWAGFALVHPRLNPSYARATERYRTLLRDPASLRVATIEAMLDAQVLPRGLSDLFRERYLWDV